MCAFFFLPPITFVFRPQLFRRYFYYFKKEKRKAMKMPKWIRIQGTGNTENGNGCSGCGECSCHRATGGALPCPSGRGEVRPPCGWRESSGGGQDETGLSHPPGIRFWAQLFRWELCSRDYRKGSWGVFPLSLRINLHFERNYMKKNWKAKNDWLPGLNV